MLLTIYPERVAVDMMKKHVAAYAKGVRGGKAVKLKAFSAHNAADIYSAADMLTAASGFEQ